MTLAGPPAAGELWPIGFVGDERLSACFEFSFEVLTPNVDLPAGNLLHQPICLTLQNSDGPIRYCHGLIRRMTALDSSQFDRWRYVLEVVPRLWFLSLTQDCRVFQQKTAREIMSALFNDAGIADVDFRLHNPPEARDYTVQMNETDLIFVSRLMQEEGWFYFFEHAADKHVLVVADSNAAMGLVPHPKVSIHPNLTVMGDINRWKSVESAAIGQTVMKDYDPTTPSAPLEATQNTLLTMPAPTSRDVFKWPAMAFKSADVEKRTRQGMEAAEARASLIEATGNHFGFVAGGRFILDEEPQTGAKNQNFAIYQISHQASQPGQRSATGGHSGYFNSFITFPHSQIWRDLFSVERPLMAGIYSATVIGPDNEEIYTDEYGRVKVLFPWDRRQDSTAGGSVWLRVIQPWAGPGWGVQFLPRVGTEVAVAFVDGDIDRPVVVGGIYNGKDKPVFPLPDQKNKSGLRTRSTLKGGVDNFSELSFDDTKGSEVVFFQAEKDHKVNIKNNDTQSIGAVQSVTIGSGQHTTIASDPKAAESGNTYTLDVGNGDALTTIDKGNYTVIAKQGITVDSTDSDILVQADKGNITTDAQKGDITVKAELGNITTSAKQTLAQSGLKVTMDGTTSIELTVGSNSIKIDQAGVTISGLMIKISGTATAEMGSPMTKVSGDGMLTLRGGITMIN